MHKRPFPASVLALVVAAACGESIPTEPDAAGASPSFAGVSSASADVHVFPAGPAIPGASARLQRSAAGVNAWFQTRDLLPGHAYTLWYVVFNHPAACLAPNACALADVFTFDPDVAVDLINGGAIVAGSSGKGTLAGRVKVGELGIRGIGLLDGFEADIHLVVRDHGPKAAGSAQLAEFGGGCDVYACANVQVAADF